jgi:DNA-binding response OmpR family regulator
VVRSKKEVPSPMPIKVLIIDDDSRLRALLAEYLAENGVLSQGADDGEMGLSVLGAAGFDAVILDIMMPGMDGLSVLREIRKKSAIPVVMLTAKGDETDRVVGLELGADDYLAKPFSPRELLARIRAVLRRGTNSTAGAWLRLGTLELNTETREVRACSQPVDLTAIEFDFLRCLLERPGRVISRRALLELSGRDDAVVNERAIDVHISHLRKKLGDHTAKRLIKTVRGVGYVLGGSRA